MNDESMAAPDDDRLAPSSSRFWPGSVAVNGRP